jgi:TRAP-type C4-dicarboxylate transport system permease large subunit
MVPAWGVRESASSPARAPEVQAAEAGASLWAAKWELAMPAVVIVSMFSGLRRPSAAPRR